MYLIVHINQVLCNCVFQNSIVDGKIIHCFLLLYIYKIIPICPGPFLYGVCKVSYYDTLITV